MITLDSRTGSVGLMRYLPPNACRVGYLEYADAMFIGNGADSPVLVGVERKTLRDLVDSMETGRLSGHQLPGLLSSYGVVYLVVEGIGRDQGGRYQDLCGKKWRDLVSTQGLNNYLNTLMVICGVHILRTTNDRDTATVILNLYEWWQKPWDRHRGYLAFYEPPKPGAIFTKPSLLRRVAKELPGIGWERSAAVEKHFPTVVDMINALPHEWREIPGIGKSLAYEVHKVLNGL